MSNVAKAMRPGEDIDSPELRAYLGAKLRSTDLEVLQFRGGHSNLTYLVRADDREYVLRRPPFGSRVKSAHDMQREYRVLSALAPVWGKAPRPAALCTDPSVIGCDFYLMEKRDGVILRAKVGEDLNLDAPTARKLCLTLVDTLAELHAFQPDALGLDDFGKPEGYIARQVEGWSKRYTDSQTDDIDEMDSVRQWLHSNQPVEGRPSLIHNDFKFDNVVLSSSDLTQITSVLDWEMATVGDPMMDLGTALCYWVDPDDPPPMHLLPFGPTKRPGMLSRRELAERYGEITNDPRSTHVFYYAFGLFKTAVVAQQIYYRFKQGATQDPRFAQMIMGVRVLTSAAARAIARGAL